MKKKRLSEAQILLVIHLGELWPAQKDMLVTEFKFDPERRWKFDVAFPLRKLAFECDGGKWTGGHRRGRALEDDYERQNTAIAMGWLLLRFTNEQILKGSAKRFIQKYL